jgi:hypothetical protein
MALTFSPINSKQPRGLVLAHRSTARAAQRQRETDITGPTFGTHQKSRREALEAKILEKKSSHLLWTELIEGGIDSSFWFSCELGRDRAGHFFEAAATAMSSEESPKKKSEDAGTGDAGVIRPMEADSVRRIVAGQAVTDLASAVKELVDNALDAGSKSINGECSLTE